VQQRIDGARLLRQFRHGLRTKMNFVASEVTMMRKSQDRRI
jgi:hypothetical protein